MADFGEMLLRLMGIGGGDPSSGGTAVTPPNAGKLVMDDYTGNVSSTRDPHNGQTPDLDINGAPGFGFNPTGGGATPVTEGRSVALPPPLQLPGGAGGPAPAPAPIVAPPVGSTPGSTAPAPAPAIGGPATPPDLSALYSKLVEDQRRDANFNQGLNMIAAGFAQPGNRASLLALPTNTGPDPATALQTLMAIRNDNTKQQNTATDRAALPSIATKLGLDLPTVTTLYNSGKLSDVLTDAAKPHTQVVGDAKSGYRLVDTRTGSKIADISEGVSDESNAAKKINDAQTNWQKYQLPDPKDPANVQFWKDFSTKVLAGSGGTTVNVGGEKFFDRHMAEKIYGPAVEQGSAALSANHTLDYMKNLALTANGNLPSGPAALLDLKAREGLATFLGAPIEGVSEAEGINKLNQQLATASVKAISSRPTQMEFAKALENNPSLLQTPGGRLMMIEILKQDNAAKAGIAQLALDPNNHGPQWIDKVDQYYRDHPLKSPFDNSRAFGKEDIDLLNDPNAIKIVEGKMYFKKGNAWHKADSN